MRWHNHSVTDQENLVTGQRSVATGVRGDPLTGSLRGEEGRGGVDRTLVTGVRVASRYQAKLKRSGRHCP